MCETLVRVMKLTRCLVVGWRNTSSDQWPPFIRPFNSDTLLSLGYSVVNVLSLRPPPHYLFHNGLSSLFPALSYILYIQDFIYTVQNQNRAIVTGLSAL